MLIAFRGLLVLLVASKKRGGDALLGMRERLRSA